MKLNATDFPSQMLWIVCMMKVFHDAGIYNLEDDNADIGLEPDYFYMFVIDALDCAAPFIDYSEKICQKYGYREIDDVNVRAYSSTEMKECFHLAHKLDRLNRGSKRKKEYEKQLEKKMEDLKGFDSYSFDWHIGNKRKGAQLEILWGYEFCEDVALCMWIVRTMKMFKEELPKLQEEYRKARRKRRCEKSMGQGGVLCAA